jgi:iron complex outermembrane receptor protein
MLSRPKILGLSAVLASQLCVSGIAFAQDAQGNPTNTPPATDSTGAAAPTGAVPAVPGGSTPEEAIAPPKRKSAEEEIVVTGSRVRRKDLTTAAPVTVISRQQIDSSGVATVGDFLQLMPSQGNAANTNSNNGGDGQTNISLRSLGAARTLVLLDGKRMVAGGFGAGTGVDLNTIPTAMIERIEVLKDGASAAYGSDAIAGVVNIITRKRFNGTEVSAYGGISGHGDGNVTDLSVASGVANDHGSFMFGAGYYDQKSIFASARDWAKAAQAYDYAPKCTDAAGTTPPGCTLTGGTEAPQGSSRIPQGRITLNPGNCAASADPAQAKLCSGLVARYGAKKRNWIYTGPRDDTGTAQQDPANWRVYGNSAQNKAGLADPANAVDDSYNFQAVNYLSTPATRISLFANGEYKLGDVAKAYFQGTYVNHTAAQALAPAAITTDSPGVAQFSGQNPYNPFGIDSVNLRRRIIETGPRVTRSDLNTFRVVAGLTGSLPDPISNWFWDVSLNYGRTTGPNDSIGFFDTRPTNQALGPGFKDATGYHCGTPAAPIANCTPINPFGAGGLTPDMLASMGQYDAINFGFTQMTSAEAHVGGDLFSLAADRPVALAAGYQFRRELGGYFQNPVAAAGEDLYGVNGLSTQGSFYANEVYGELSIPIVNKIPFVDDLEADAAVRLSNYNTFGSNTTFKVGGRYRPIRDVTVRGTYSTGFRAPSITDLFGGNALSAEGATDPCAGSADTTSAAYIKPRSALAKQCGAAANNLSSDNQINSTVGGNAKLQPETSKSYTVGLVFQPTTVKNFSATLDLWHVRIEQNIGVVSTPIILQGCYGGDAGSNPAYCKLISRDPVSQLIANVNDTNQNVGYTETGGIDLALRYAMNTEVGRFGFLFDGTYLLSYDQQLADFTLVHGVGVYDLGVNPRVKFVAGAQYALPMGDSTFSAGLNMRFVGPYHECADPFGGSSGSGLCYAHNLNSDADGNSIDNFTQHQIPAYTNWDLALGYSLKSGAGLTTLALGIRNLLNQDPPRVYDTTTSTNSDGSTYDYIGRVFYGRISHTF